MTCDISGVKIIGYFKHELIGFFTSFCRGCSRPIGGGFQCSTPEGRKNFIAYRDWQEISLLSSNSINLGDGINIARTWPEFPKPKRFDYLPPEVENVMRDAEDARCCKAPNRMVRGEYRTVIDVATQYIFTANLAAFKPGTNPVQKLNNRIDMLASKHFLTPSLRDWAHGIRFITNEDVHTSNDVSAEEVTEIAEFTDMLLQYLFELPGRVKQAKETAEQKRAAAETEG